MSGKNNMMEERDGEVPGNEIAELKKRYLDHIKQLLEKGFIAIYSMRQSGKWIIFSSDIDLSEDDINEMANYAVLLYLISWLEHDPNANQSINGYANDGLVPIAERKNKQYRTSQHQSRGNVRYAATNYDKMMESREAQRKTEGTLPNAPLRTLSEVKQEVSERQTAAGQKDFTNPRISAKEKPRNVGKAYSFPGLMFMDWMVDGNLLVYKILTDRKQVMQSKNKQGDKRNSVIREAFSKYFAAIQPIVAFEQGDNSLTLDSDIYKDSIIYVSTRMMLYTLEQAYRFSFVTALAQAAVLHEQDETGRKTHLETLRDSYDLTFSWWGRFECIGVVVKGESYKIINEPYLLPIDDAIESAYLPERDRLLRVQRHLLKRTIVAHLAEMTNASDEHNPRAMHSWTKSDFAATSNFFRQEMPISEMLCLRRLTQKGPSWEDGALNDIGEVAADWPDLLCDGIREVYAWFMENADEGFFKDTGVRNAPD